MLQSSYDEIELDDKYACGDLAVIFGKAPTSKTEVPYSWKEVPVNKVPTSVEYYPPGNLKYYAVGGIEVIDYIKAKLTPEQYEGYLLGNIYKYSGRMNFKGEFFKDIEKLQEYTAWLKEHNVNNA